ncbi:hypothetical protein ON010_g2256 [Phytophthora cinnamomi]|nr:hypothetical protein ON010_g2256 [Phytophthora cinnamomi]
MTFHFVSALLLARYLCRRLDSWLIRWVLGTLAHGLNIDAAGGSSAGRDQLGQIRQIDGLGSARLEVQVQRESARDSRSTWSLLLLVPLPSVRLGAAVRAAVDAATGGAVEMQVLKPLPDCRRVITRAATDGIRQRDGRTLLFRALARVQRVGREAVLLCEGCKFEPAQAAARGVDGARVDGAGQAHAVVLAADVSAVVADLDAPLAQNGVAEAAALGDRPLGDTVSAGLAVSVAVAVDRRGGSGCLLRSQLAHDLEHLVEVVGRLLVGGDGLLHDPVGQAPAVDVHERHVLQHVGAVGLPEDHAGHAHVGAHGPVGVLRGRAAQVVDRPHAARPHAAARVAVHERVHVLEEAHVAAVRQLGRRLPQRPAHGRSVQGLLFGRACQLIQPSGARGVQHHRHAAVLIQEQVGHLLQRAEEHRRRPHGHGLVVHRAVRHVEHLAVAAEAHSGLHRWEQLVVRGLGVHEELIEDATPRATSRAPGSKSIDLSAVAEARMAASMLEEERPEQMGAAVLDRAEPRRLDGDAPCARRRSGSSTASQELGAFVRRGDPFADLGGCVSAGDRQGSTGDAGAAVDGSRWRGHEVEMTKVSATAPAIGYMKGFRREMRPIMRVAPSVLSRELEPNQLHRRSPTDAASSSLASFRVRTNLSAEVEAWRKTLSQEDVVQQLASSEALGRYFTQPALAQAHLAAVTSTRQPSCCPTAPGAVDSETRQADGQPPLQRASCISMLVSNKTLDQSGVMSRQNTLASASLSTIYSTTLMLNIVQIRQVHRGG